MNGSMNKYIEEAESVLLHTYNRFPVVFDHGKGVRLYDTDGKEYLDFCAGIAVFALGYGNEEYNNALKAQIEQESNELEKEYLREMNEDAERVNRLTQIETLAYRESVRALKIIIPESLREIYEKVNVTASQK